MNLKEYLKEYKPNKESLNIVDFVFSQNDIRYESPWDKIIVAGFITRGALNINSTRINMSEFVETKSDTSVKGPQEDLKRLASRLLEKKGFQVEGYEIPIPGGIVDVLGKKGDELIAVECGPCRIDKPIEYLKRDKMTLWIITRDNVLYEITRGKDWKKMLDFHRSHQIEKAREYVDQAFSNF